MPSGDPYEIRAATLADWPAIEHFVRATYGPSAPFKSLARLRWQLIDTPYAPPAGASDSLLSWIALHQGEVAGQISLQPGRAFIDGLPLDAGWVVDVMVSPAHRGQGLGHRIHAAMRDAGHTLVTLTMAEATRRIAEKAGCVTLGPVEQLARVRRLSPATLSALLVERTDRRASLRAAGRAFAASGIGPALASQVSGIVGPAWRGFAPLPAPAAGIEDVSGWEPQAVAALWVRMQARLPALFDRSPEFCAWRLAAPDLAYRFARRVRGGETVGLVAWRLPLPCELSVGTVVEVLGDPADAETLAGLVVHAVARMERHCDAVVAAAARPEFLAAYRAAGFRTLRRHYPTVVSSDPAVMQRFAAHGAAWHFSKADHDWDQVHAVR